MRKIKGGRGRKAKSLGGTAKIADIFILIVLQFFKFYLGCIPFDMAIQKK
jgi:hypothetical protein